MKIDKQDLLISLPVILTAQGFFIGFSFPLVAAILVTGCFYFVNEHIEIGKTIKKYDQRLIDLETYTKELSEKIQTVKNNQGVSSMVIKR